MARRPWDPTISPLLNQLERVADLAVKAHERRDVLIRAARHVGAPTADIARAAGVTPARIGQITAAPASEDAPDA